MTDDKNPARSYPDLHDHLEELDKRGLLVRVDREINKDTEMHPLVRWQFRGGIEEKDRKAFLFTNVVDSKGRKFDIPVAVGVLAASRDRAPAAGIWALPAMSNAISIGIAPADAIASWPLLLPSARCATEFAACICALALPDLSSCTRGGMAPALARAF